MYLSLPLNRQIQNGFKAASPTKNPGRSKNERRDLRASNTTPFANAMQGLVRSANGRKEEAKASRTS
jgi:hypothetical protein